MKKMPKDHKQITLILPLETIQKLDKICACENRRRPAQIKHWIERDRNVQFTGLYDNKRTKEFPNGQPIFEGDILLFEDFHTSNGQNTFYKLLPVKYDPDDAMYVVGNNYCALYEIRKYTNGCEIKGNIYEHPYLLKDSKYL